MPPARRNRAIFGELGEILDWEAMSSPLASRRRFLTATSSSSASSLILPSGTLFGKEASLNGKLNVTIARGTAFLVWRLREPFEAEKGGI